MKTKIISSLNKTIMLIELPDNAYNIRTFSDQPYAKYYQKFNAKKFHPPLGFKILSTLNNLTEENTQNLPKIAFNEPKLYHVYPDSTVYSSPLEATLSAIKDEINFTNPIPKPKYIETDSGGAVLDNEWLYDYQHEEAKTFNIEKTLVLIEK